MASSLELSVLQTGKNQSALPSGREGQVRQARVENSGMRWLKQILLTFPRRGVERNKACREEGEEGRGGGLLDYRGRARGIGWLEDGPRLMGWKCMIAGPDPTGLP